MNCEKPLPVPKQRGMSEKRNLEVELCQGKEILLPRLTPAIPGGPSKFRKINVQYCELRVDGFQSHDLKAADLTRDNAKFT